MEKAHSFYCNHCRQYLFEKTPVLLAIYLNQHNDKFHPQASASWTAESLIRSAHYSGPYVVTANVGGQNWGDAKPPVITVQDRKLLKGLCISWD